MMAVSAKNGHLGVLQYLYDVGCDFALERRRRVHLANDESLPSSPSCGTPSSMGAIHRGIPPDQRRRRFSTPARRARSMMRRLSFTFFHSRRLVGRLRGGSDRQCVISITSPVLHRYLVHDATIFIATRLHRFDAFAASRCARATLVVDRVSPRPAYLLQPIHHPTHLVRPSVRSRRDATRSPGSMRATTTMTRGRARVDASAPVRATTTRARARRAAARDRATDARGGRARESERLAVFLSKRGDTRASRRRGGR